MLQDWVVQQNTNGNNQLKDVHPKLGPKPKTSLPAEVPYTLNRKPQTLRVPRLKVDLS